MLLNKDIVNIKGICSLAFVVHGFSELFLNPSIFSIRHSRSTKIVDGTLSDFWY